MSKQIMIISAIFIALSFNVFGQKIYHKGQIIQNDGELIDCLIEEDIPINYEKRVRFKRSENGELELKHANEIKGFVIDGKEKYMSFVINQKSSVPAGFFMYKRSQIFIKQIEEGKLNLYLYREGKENWLYIQKGNGKIHRLELVRIEYASRLEQDKIIKLDTLSSSKPSRKGFFKLQKNYLKTINSLIDDPKNKVEELSLYKKLIRKFVINYNNSKSKEVAVNSYFKKGFKGRLLLVGGRVPLGDFKLGLFGAEVEFILPTKKWERSLVFGFIKGTNIKKGTIDHKGYELEKDIINKQLYLRVNQYLSIGNKIKPYAILGLKITLSKFPNFSNFSLGQKEPNVSGAGAALTHFGVGMLYLLPSNLVVKAEVSNRFFPDIKIGIGKQF